MSILPVLGQRPNGEVQLSPEEFGDIAKALLGQQQSVEKKPAMKAAIKEEIEMLASDGKDLEPMEIYMTPE